MRRLIAALLLGAVLIAWGSDRQPADATRPIVWHEPASVRSASPGELRIASFNIHSGKGGDGRLDLARTAGELEDVDLAGLFEVRATPWSRSPDQAAELGERLGMRSAFLPTERRWWHDHFGNAVLTGVPIAGLQRVPLIGTRGKAFRQAVLIDVPLQNVTVHIVMVHVDRERDREPQLAAVIRLFQSLALPAVLMGDLNSAPDDPQLRELLAAPGVKSVVDSLPQEIVPQKMIDWMIVRGLECASAELHERGASDHPILRATLRLPDNDAPTP